MGKKRGFGKRGQELFGMSFGMIFSIILIIFFIVVAFIAIRAFLGTRDCAKVGIFVKEIQDEVNKAWNSNGQTEEFIGYLPSKIEMVCFANLSNRFSGSYKYVGDEIILYEEDNNMFFYPVNKACDSPNHKILHLDIEKITKNQNPFCINVDKGKVIMNVEKATDERLVTIGN